MNNIIVAMSELKEDTTSSHFDGAVPPQQPPPPFVVGEKVLATFGDYIYHARVEKVDFGEDWQFYIHYWRWSRSWDEWVGVDRLMKLENSGHVSESKKQVTNAKMLHLSQKENCTPSDIGGKKLKNVSLSKSHKRKRERITVKGKYCKSVGKLINIPFPPTLKKQLMDDCCFIMTNGKLVKLPRTPNVDDIMEKFREYRRKKDAELSTSLGEHLSGLRTYFNEALPVILLYNNERQQFQEAIAENMPPSAVYGAEHLLRLFVKLPALLFDLNIEEETLKDLQKNLHEFLKFLHKNQREFFLSTYHVPQHA